MSARLIGAIVATCVLSVTPTLAADYPADVRFAQIGMQKADHADGIRRLLPPNSPVPKVGPHATELEYARWARSSLSRGQDAEAELSLEWGQLRNRVDEELAAYEAGLPPPPYDNLCERSMCQGLRAIGRGRESEAMAFIDRSISEIVIRDAAVTRTASR